MKISLVGGCMYVCIDIYWVYYIDLYDYVLNSC